MSYEIRQFAAVIPAGTALAAPVAIDCAFPTRIVRRIEVTIPPGPQGEMGFAVAVNGQNIIPYNASSWIVADDEKMTWDMDGQIETGAWQIRGYNTGQYQHTVYIRFLLDVVQGPDPAPALVAPIDTATLSTADVGASDAGL